MGAKAIDSRVRRAFNDIRQAFRGKVARVKVAGGVQQIQVEGLEGEIVQDLKRAGNFGLTSNPSAGNDCVVVPLGGKASHGIIVTTTNGAYRITGLTEGETTIYNTDGAKMMLKEDRIIEIDCGALNTKAPGGVNIDASNVGCTAQVTAEGQINGNGGMAVKGGSSTSFTDNAKMIGDLNTTGKLINNGKSVGSDHKRIGDSGGTASDPL